MTSEEKVGNRPWGLYHVLADADDFKVKEIYVKPGHRLSLQSHEHRDEHWVCIRGSGTVEIDGVELLFYPGCSLDIERGQKHRVSCVGDEELLFIEVQTGDYFGEDDITRFSDDYNRVKD